MGNAALSHIVKTPADWMFVACVVFVLLARACRSESLYPPLEIIRVGKPPAKLFGDTKDESSKIHLSAEIREAVLLKKMEQETPPSSPEQKKESLREQVAQLKKLVETLESRLNTVEDWVHVESDLLEQEFQMRAKAHERTLKQKV